MTGPEHYREAERLLKDAAIDLELGDTEGNRYEHDSQVARAQVHATLALVAATAQGVGGGDQRLVHQPLPGDGIDPPYPGNDWGRALFGEVPHA